MLDVDGEVVLREDEREPKKFDQVNGNSERKGFLYKSTVRMKEEIKVERRKVMKIWESQVLTMTKRRQEETMQTMRE